MGAATGPVVILMEERRLVGTTVARAVRLEGAAENGQIVVDVDTYDLFPASLKKLYGAQETIAGKRDELFQARRCSLRPGDELLSNQIKVAKRRSLQSRLESSDPGLRAKALFQIAMRQDESFLDTVVVIVANDSDEKVREAAAFALDQFHDVRAKDALLMALHDPVWAVRSSAGWGLVHLGRTAVEEDVRLLAKENSDPNVSEMTTMILDRL